MPRLSSWPGPNDVLPPPAPSSAPGGISWMTPAAMEEMRQLRRDRNADPWPGDDIFLPPIWLIVVVWTALWIALPALLYWELTP